MTQFRFVPEVTLDGDDLWRPWWPNELSLLSGKEILAALEEDRKAEVAFSESRARLCEALCDYQEARRVLLDSHARLRSALSPLRLVDREVEVEA